MHAHALNLSMILFCSTQTPQVQIYPLPVLVGELIDNGLGAEASNIAIGVDRHETNTAADSNDNEDAEDGSEQQPQAKEQHVITYSDDGVSTC